MALARLSAPLCGRRGCAVTHRSARRRDERVRDEAIQKLPADLIGRLPQNAQMPGEPASALVAALSDAMLSRYEMAMPLKDRFVAGRAARIGCAMLPTKFVRC